MSINKTSNCKQNEKLYHRAKHDKENPFGQLAEKTMNDLNLSINARFALLKIFSNRDDWKIYPLKLAKDIGVSREVIYKILRELMDNGYCLRKENRDSRGRILEHTYIFSELQNEDFKKQKKTKEKSSTKQSYPHTENPYTAQQDQEKPHNNYTSCELNPKTTTREVPTQKIQPHVKPASKKPVVVSFYDCLIQDERLTDDNRKALMRFPEKRVILALQFSHQVPPNQSLIQQLVWHCTQTKPPEKILPFSDKVKMHFKNYNTYNGATCYIQNDLISFERGMTNKSAKMNCNNQVISLLKHFGISGNMLINQNL